VDIGMSAARAGRKASRPFATRSRHGRVKRIARSSTSARYHLVFRRRLHLISREIERDAVILVGAGRKVESEFAVMAAMHLPSAPISPE
jgi:hypothetical protein